MSVREIPGVQNPVTRHARRLGWYARRVTYIDKRGCPDTWFFREGRLVICEWKREGKEPDVQQERRIAELRAAGMEVYVIDTAEAGRALLDRLEADFVPVL